MMSNAFNNALKLKQRVSVTDFGAVGDGTTDDTEAIQSAIDAAGAGEVYLPAGVYLTSAALNLETEGVSLIGAGGLTTHSSAVVGSSGVVGEGEHSGATRIVGGSTSGAVIRIWADGCSVRDLCVDASSTRKAAARSTNAGIWIEAADTSGASTKRAQITRVRITNQPGEGLVMVNDVVASRIDMLDVDHVKGHGIRISGGVLTSRSNKTRPGQVQINNARVSRTGGHSICVGGNDTLSTDVPYRIEIHNFECFYNCITPAILVDPANPANAYISAENVLVTISAFDGRSEYPSVADTHACLTLRGNNIRVITPRFIDGLTNAARVEGHPAFSSISRSVTMTDVYLNNSLRGAGYYNPAIYFGSDVRGVRVQTDLALSGVTTLTSRTVNTNYVEDWAGTVRTNNYTAGMNVGYLRASSEVTLADDAAGYIDFGQVARGILTISGNVSTAGAVVLFFRCGDGSAHATALSSGGITVGTSTGALAGSTGTDARLNVSADSATNRVYIENRTGATRTYSYTLSPLAGDTGFAPATFVNL